MNPPQDGSPFIATGNVIYPDSEFSVAAEHFGPITLRWESGTWVKPDGMSLPMSLEDEVCFHFWTAI